MTIATKTVGESSITFTWSDNTETIVHLDDIPEVMHDRICVHGLGQKLGDSYSGVKGDVAAAKELFNATLDALKAGEWNRKGSGGASGSIWVEAIARVTYQEIEDVLEKWNAMDAATKAATRKHPQVALAKTEIDRERASVKAANVPAFTF